VLDQRMHLLIVNRSRWSDCSARDLLANSS
jgi:hypothetical protein